MHKILQLTFLLNLTALATPAASFTNPPQDTLIVDSSNYHLDQKQFLSTYGNNRKAATSSNFFFITGSSVAQCW